jgi:hypothetical protein
MKLGDLSKKYANAALQVYLELCEVRKYWDVEYKYDGDLGMLYFTAKKTKSEKTSVFVPRCSSDDLSYTQMQSYFALCDNSEIKSVFLALVSSDSTCVFYQITEGLNQPVDTSARHSKLNRQEKLDADIRKHKNLITEAALCGMSITIRDQKN